MRTFRRGNLRRTVGRPIVGNNDFPVHAGSTHNLQRLPYALPDCLHLVQAGNHHRQLDVLPARRGTVIGVALNRWLWDISQPPFSIHVLLPHLLLPDGLRYKRLKLCSYLVLNRSEKDNVVSYPEIVGGSEVDRLR